MSESPRLTRDEILSLKRLAKAETNKFKIAAIPVVLVFPVFPIILLAVFLFPRKYWLKMWGAQFLLFFVILGLGLLLIFLNRDLAASILIKPQF